MKKVGNIYKRITDLNIIMDMYENIVSKNTKNKSKIEKFERFYSLNLINIKEELSNNSYSW